MRFSRSLTAVLCVALLAAIAGCGGESTPGDNSAANGTQITPGQLADQIIKMAAQPEVYSATAERHILTDQLNAMGPASLAPIVDYMAAPDTAPTARLFILQCVAPHMTPVYIANIKPMIESKDEVTRAVGVMALGHIKNETVAQLLKMARNDSSPRVSFSALSGLVMQGDPAARAEMKQLYTSGVAVGDIKVEDVKREAVRVIVRDATAEDVPMLEDALNQGFLEVNSRVMIAETLGRLADASAIPLLEQSLNLQKEPEYGEMVKQAIAAINGREKKA